MTFGLICDPDKDIPALLKEADEKLYIGKTNGRNQVVS
jgi:PleD family two-component response regulator